MAFNKNEVVATKRQVRLFLYSTDGVTPLPWTTVLTGCVWVDVGTNNAAAAAGTITNNTRSVTFADQTITAFPGSNNATATAHPFLDAAGNAKSGVGPVRLTTTGTLPTGLAINTDYYIIGVDLNTVAFATSRANAGAGTKIALTGSGTGTIKITQTGVSTPTTTPIDGSWTYQATQTEANNSASELTVHAEKAGTFLMREVTVEMKDAGGFDVVGEGSNTYGDLIRLMVGVLAGKVSNYTTGSYSFKSLDGTKTRVSFTSDATGRLTVTVVDLS